MNLQVKSKWLDGPALRCRFEYEEFVKHRIVFYPGHGGDGRPVKIFGKSHRARCFVMVDYGYSDAMLTTDLSDDRRGFKGYRVIVSENVNKNALPNEILDIERMPLQLSEVISEREMEARHGRLADLQPYARFVLLERLPSFDASHGPERLAILFLGADGVSAYLSIFPAACESKAPYAVVLQDSGFNGNYSVFGRGGVLNQCAERGGMLPPRLLVEETTREWSGYLLMHEEPSKRRARRLTRRLSFQMWRRHYLNERPIC